MKKIGYILQYWLLLLLSWAMVCLPERAALALGSALGTLAFCLGLRRQVAIENLRHAFAANRPDKNREIAQSMYRYLGMNLAELLRFKRTDCRQIGQKVILTGTEHLDNVLEQGKGAILVSAHFGNWEMFAAALACHGYPFSVVVYPQHNQAADRMLNRLRESKGVKVIYKKNASREVLTALRQNRFVTMLADQDAGPEGQMVNFLGRPASVTKGPAVFAIKTGAPIITGVIVRQENAHHRGYIDQPLFPELSNRVEAEVIRLTEAFTRRLEKYVIAHPGHWYWVHRRWKTRPQGEIR